MSIYDQEAPSGLFLNLKDTGNVANARLFGEPIMFVKDTEFDGKKEKKDSFATLCLYRNPKTKESEVKVYEFGWGVQKQLRNLYQDEEWGDPNKGEYDVTIKREGEGKQTKYFVTPRPKKALSAADLALIDKSDVDLRKTLKIDAQGAPVEDDGYSPYDDE